MDPTEGLASGRFVVESWLFSPPAFFWLCHAACEKPGLKLNIHRTKIMASGPITSWHIDGEKMKIVTDFIFLGSKITAGGDCSHEIKRHLLLGGKVMTNLLKKHRYHFANKGPSCQSYGFSSSYI